MPLRSESMVRAIVVAWMPWACACGSASSTSATPTDGGTTAIVDASADAARDASAPDSAVPSDPSVLLFAGDGPEIFKDTWEWNGVSWKQRSVTGPSGRFHHAMSTLNGKVVLFGGTDLKSDFGDTWEWDGLAWTQRMVTGPSPRHGHTMATMDKKILLYGGSGPSGTFLDDTWEWDGTSWTQQMLTGPGMRYGHVMATRADTVVLFGGVGALDDTWVWDGVQWTQRVVTGPSPSERAFAAMASNDVTVILFGGQEDANHIVNDTWEWNGETWTNRTMTTSPGPRYHHGMTSYDGKIVLFGGSPPAGAATPYLGDTWYWQGAGWTESLVPGPTARFVYSLGAR